MAITSANQLELLQTAEAVAREKMIDPVLVIEAMEESLARAAKSRYGAEMDIRVSIDRKTGKATFTRVRTVVEEEELENYQAEFTVEQAKQYLDDPKVGDQLVEEVPPVDMGRIAAQSAKQVITHTHTHTIYLSISTLPTSFTAPPPHHPFSLSLHH